jgi:hypothetical protein
MNKKTYAVAFSKTFQETGTLLVEASDIDEAHLIFHHTDEKKLDGLVNAISDDEYEVQDIVSYGLDDFMEGGQDAH